MNENHWKVNIGNKRKTKLRTKQMWVSYWVKPSGKFWKRYFNKRVRKGKIHKRDNWFEWSWKDINISVTCAQMEYGEHSDRYDNIKLLKELKHYGKS